ncbi:mRNA decapping [Cyclospora cayetanensis]|uniref:mRNA decapping n=1 Tax=Cyclospora cayetanensis TaxID=88456 RepID=A0A1D3D827_9EIME|nr:mRNA decapping [Cyclospora cayetanensis]
MRHSLLYPPSCIRAAALPLAGGGGEGVLSDQAFQREEQHQQEHRNHHHHHHQQEEQTASAARAFTPSSVPPPAYMQQKQEAQRRQQLIIQQQRRGGSCSSADHEFAAVAGDVESEGQLSPPPAPYLCAAVTPSDISDCAAIGDRRAGSLLSVPSAPSNDDGPPSEGGESYSEASLPIIAELQHWNADAAAASRATRQRDSTLALDESAPGGALDTSAAALREAAALRSGALTPRNSAGTAARSSSRLPPRRRPRGRRAGGSSQESHGRSQSDGKQAGLLLS